MQVIHKSLRESWPLRYSSREGHAEDENVNRATDTPSFCPTLQFPARVMCWLIRARDKRFSHTLDSLCRWPRPNCSFRSAQTVTLLEFHVPLTNSFFRWWYCAVHGPKLPLHHHKWLSFGKFQDTERFLIPCPRQVSSRLPPSGEICKYATASSSQKKVERFSNYWYDPFCCVCLGCFATEFRISLGTYELHCIIPYEYVLSGRRVAACGQADKKTSGRTNRAHGRTEIRELIAILNCRARLKKLGYYLMHYIQPDDELDDWEIIVGFCA
jgi:hypothetical protein